MRPATDALHDHLQERLGDALRTIVYYDTEKENAIYVREDVRQDVSPEQAGAIIDHLREREDLREVRTEIGLDTSLHCIVRCWEDRIGLHFPHSPESGTLVEIESNVARDLHSFVTECESILEE